LNIAVISVFIIVALNLITTKSDKLFEIIGYRSYTVLSGSMEPEFYPGDMVITKHKSKTDIKVNDIVTYRDNDGIIITHRIIEETPEGYITKGDNNNTQDIYHVSEDKVIGIYKFRIPGLGRISMFMSTTPGLIICVFCPLILLVGYDMIRRKLYEKNNQQDTEALLAELEALKAEKAKNENIASSDQEQSSDTTD
jgi:signal peptidase